jgi:transcriptional regulator with XRE-family HTH domain
MFMSRAAFASKRMPQGVDYALTTLGENLRIARERRGESLRDWASRLEVSVPTLQRMERGDPTVGMGVYATAFWLCGLVEALALAADPSADRGAQEIEIARAARRRRK